MDKLVNERNCERTCGPRVIKMTLFVTILVVLMSVTVIQHNDSRPRYLLVPGAVKPLQQKTLPPNISCPELKWRQQRYPLTALASFPGSGNTWTRHLIQKMTGIPTGAVYNNYFLRHHGYPGEGTKNESVVVIKTHLNYAQRYNKSILLMRNPFEAFIAEFNRRYTHNQTAYVKLEVFVEKWNRYFEDMCGKYTSFYVSWLNHKSLLLVLYQNLKKGLALELDRMLTFLQNSATITGNVQCALNDPTGIVKRDHSKSLPYKFFYSKKKILKLNGIITKVSEAYNNRFPEESLLMRKWKMGMN